MSHNSATLWCFGISYAHKRMLRLLRSLGPASAFYTTPRSLLSSRASRRDLHLATLSAQFLGFPLSSHISALGPGPSPTARTMATAATAGGKELVAAYVTVPDRDVAKRLASGIVEARLAACVNIIPGIESVYTWEGKVNVDSELLLMIKTRSELREELTAYVRSNHPYKVCEVIFTAITGGNPPYMDWVVESTKEPAA